MYYSLIIYYVDTLNDFNPVENNCIQSVMSMGQRKKCWLPDDESSPLSASHMSDALTTEVQETHGELLLHTAGTGNVESV